MLYNSQKDHPLVAPLDHPQSLHQGVEGSRPSHEFAQRITRPVPHSVVQSRIKWQGTYLQGSIFQYSEVQFR